MKPNTRAHARVARAVFGVVLVLTAMSRPNPPTRAAGSMPNQRVRVLTGFSGGGFHALSDDLLDVYKRTMPQATFVSQTGLSTAASLQAIQDDRADLTFAFADEAYAAFVGRPQVGAHPFDHLRAIADLGVTPIQFVVRRGSSISSVRDLRGKRVSIGGPGSNTELVVKKLLTAYGIDAKDVRLVTLAPSKAFQAMIDGSIDAVFVATIYPADWIQRATAAGAHLASLVGPEVDRLRRDYWFFRVARIPPLAYPDQENPVFTIGVDSLLICRRDLDEPLVHDVTQAFFDALPRLSSARTALRFMDVDQAAAVPIPLHAGAARYYRERELRR